jgi:hypothetical protein
VTTSTKIARVLTAKGRKRIKKSNFALPGGRYPIHDASHARNALARVSQHGTPEEKAWVRIAVARKYPGIGKEAASKEEIHGLADSRGINWDNSPKFMQWSKRVTGEGHLDRMTPGQLGKMKRAIKSRPLGSKTASSAHRDYKHEYQKFHASTDAKRNRAKRNLWNRRLKSPPGKEIDHKRRLKDGGGNGRDNIRYRAIGANRADNGVGTPKRKVARIGHVDLRAKQRTTVTPKEIARLRRALKRMKLRRGETYHYIWPGRGHAVIGDVGKRVPMHVVKTLYGPRHTPPGRRLHLGRGQSSSSAARHSTSLATAPIPRAI